MENDKRTKKGSSCRKLNLMQANNLSIKEKKRQFKSNIKQTCSCIILSKITHI